MDAMSLLAWIIIGGIAGWLASIVMRTRLGLIMDIVVGIVGAFIGGVVLHLLDTTGVTGFNLWSLVVAFIGAVILLAIVRFFDNQRTVTT
jgi:uncharacterized membrane protein YeaQ/YmgE (transglycosylase-associated protein family)